MIQPISDKKRFAAAILVFIKHKKMIAEKSQSSYYRNSMFLSSISQCHNLIQVARRNCNDNSFSTLCRIFLMHEKHLRNILPASNNKSYLSQVEVLENLIQTAKTYK